MIRRPPRSTLDRSSAASDVYKRQAFLGVGQKFLGKDAILFGAAATPARAGNGVERGETVLEAHMHLGAGADNTQSVSYTHLRAHETVLDIVCRLLLEKKKQQTFKQSLALIARRTT